MLPSSVSCARRVLDIVFSILTTGQAEAGFNCFGGTARRLRNGPQVFVNTGTVQPEIHNETETTTPVPFSCRSLNKTPGGSCAQVFGRAASLTQ
jgi:hypothetical protein